jgi:hypothetical protein
MVFVLVVSVQLILCSSIKIRYDMTPTEQVAALHNSVMDTCHEKAFGSDASVARTLFEGDTPMQEFGQRWLTSDGVRRLMQDFFKNYDSDPKYIERNGLLLSMIDACIVDAQHYNASAFDIHFTAALNEATKLFVRQGALQNLVTELRKMSKIGQFIFNTAQTHTHLVELISSTTHRKGCADECGSRSQESHMRREQQMRREEQFREKQWAEQYPRCYYLHAYSRGWDEDYPTLNRWTCGDRLRYEVVDAEVAEARAKSKIACEFPKTCYCLGPCCDQVRWNGSHVIPQENYSGSCACYEYQLREFGQIIDMSNVSNNFTPPSSSGSSHKAAVGFVLTVVLGLLLLCIP